MPELSLTTDIIRSESQCGQEVLAVPVKSLSNTAEWEALVGHQSVRSVTKKAHVVTYKIETS